VALALAGRSEATASRRHSKSLALRSFGSNGGVRRTGPSSSGRPPDLLHCALALLHCALGSSMRLRRQRSEAKLFACPGSLRSFARWSPFGRPFVGRPLAVSLPLVDRLALSLGQVRRPARRARPFSHPDTRYRSSCAHSILANTSLLSHARGSWSSSVSVTWCPPPGGGGGAQFHCSRALLGRRALRALRPFLAALAAPPAAGGARG